MRPSLVEGGLREVRRELDDREAGADVDLAEVLALAGRPRWPGRPRSAAARPGGACRPRSATGTNVDGLLAGLTLHRCRLGHVLEQQRLAVLGQHGDGGGDVLRRHVVLVLVAAHELAEDLELLVAQRLGDRLGELGDAGGVDVVDGGQLHRGELGVVGLLDGPQQPLLARGHERDRLAAAPGPARAADAVHVGLGVGGDVVVDHVADPRDVEPAGGDVGGHQDVERARCAAARPCARAGPARRRR